MGARFSTRNVLREDALNGGLMVPDSPDAVMLVLPASTSLDNEAELRRLISVTVTVSVKTLHRILFLDQS
jgi:hypothetical protein